MRENFRLTPEVKAKFTAKAGTDPYDLNQAWRRLASGRIVTMEMYQRITDWVHGSRRLFATAGVGVVGLMLGLHIAFGQNGMISYFHKREESKKLQMQIDDLQLENARISKQIDALKTDPKTIEREAREQLRYARPGEVIYTLPAPPATANTSAQARK